MAFRCSCCFCCRVSFSKLYVTLLALKQAHDRPEKVRPVSESWFLLSCFDLFLFYLNSDLVVFVFILIFFFAVLLRLESEELELNLKSRNAHKSFYVVSQVKTTAVVGPAQVEDGTYPWHNSIEPLNIYVCVFREIILKDNGIINSCFHLLHLFRFFSQWPVKRLIWNLSQTKGS